MIQINVLNSPDLEMKGQHVHFKNMIYFGQDKGDILFQDTQIRNYHLQLELTNSGLTCFKNPLVSHYLINGKRTEQIIWPIQKKETIQIGQTSFEIENFLFTAPLKKKDLFNQNLDMIFKEEKFLEVKNILSILEKDLSLFNDKK